jgi:5-methylcytosine-specific restriction endonuclease McrA
MVTFIVDGRNRILHPTTKSDMIYRWLRSGKAKVLKGGLRKGEPILIQVFKNFPRLTKCKCEFRIGIDPGHNCIGYSVYKIDTINQKRIKLISGEVKTRTSEITKRISERRMYRNLRRYYRRKNVKKKYGTVKFRHPKLKNRRKQLFRPTHIHLMQTHMNLLNWIFDRIPIKESKLHIEYSRFDINKIYNQYVYEYECQQGKQCEFENIKTYVRYRDNYKCQSCKTNVYKIINKVHHIIRLKDDESDRPNNLILLCLMCYNDIHNGVLNCPSIHSLKLKKIGVLNLCIKYIFETLENVIPIQDTYGYIIKTIRKNNNIIKSYSNDASIIALSNATSFTEEFSDYEYQDYKVEVYFKQFRRHVRKWIHQLIDRKYYKLGKRTSIIRNRKKKNGQKKDSLTNFRQKHPKVQLTVTPGKVIFKRGNVNANFKPGDTFKCYRGTDIIKGNAYGQRIVDGEWFNHMKYSECRIIKRSCGLCVDWKET